MTSTANPIPWIESGKPLPPAACALQHPAALRGLVAASEDLSATRLREAYAQGMFPWFSHGEPVLWWSPDPRMVLCNEAFRLHRSLRKTLHRFRASAACDIRIDSAFGQVIRHCAAVSRPGQPGTWIGPDMVRAYEALHREGLAHSVETWIDGQLVGGLYAVSLGCSIFGESMFALQTDASKIALAALVAFARHHHMPWIDCQQNTRHLASFGAREMPRNTFLDWVRQETARPAPVWRFDPLHWDAL